VHVLFITFQTGHIFVLLESIFYSNVHRSQIIIYVCVCVYTHTHTLFTNAVKSSKYTSCNGKMMSEYCVGWSNKIPVVITEKE
jgi:hypothetical protein